MFHVNAMMVTGHLPLSQGGHIVLGTPQGYRADGLIAISGTSSSTTRSRCSAPCRRSMGRCCSSHRGHDLSSLRFAICGAAPLPVEIIRGFEAKTGVKILEGYGLTEGACISTVNPPAGETRSGSIGIASRPGDEDRHP